MGLIVESSQQKMALQSMKALLAHIRKQESESENDEDMIYLMITTDHPSVKKNDYIPRIIKIPYKFGSIRKRTILLITKDPTVPFRKQLETPDCDTENLFKGVYGLKKIRTKMGSTRSAKQIYSEYDTIMADHRVHHKLREVLGPRFYQKNKKVPFMVQMDLPERMNRAKRLKEKDEETHCDPAYVYKQVKTIMRNTYLVPNDSGNTLSVKIGTSKMTEQQLLENAEAVLQFLTQAKFKPAGGGLLKRETNWLRSCHVKSSDSTSLPVYSTDNDKTASGIIGGNNY